MYDVQCPYCRGKQEICHDDGYGYGEDEIYQQECNDCAKTFVYTTTILLSYDAGKADCLNGGEHDWKPIIGVPVEYFKNKQRCSACDKERLVKDVT